MTQEKRVLLHGPAISSSRKRLQELKKKFYPENIVVFEKGEEVSEVLTNLQSISLFDGERLVVVENPPDEFSSNYTLNPCLSGRQATPYTLILWFDHEIDTKKWTGFKVEFFPEIKEISVFPFLDLLAAKDKRAFLEVEKLKKTREGFDIQYFITMVFYLLRVLRVTPKGAKPFYKEKLLRQRKNFSPEKIKNLYREILEIDFKLKSGLLEKPQAEFLLVNKFLE